MGPATGLHGLCGDTLMPPQFGERLAKYGWRPVFWALSRVAAWIANDGGFDSPKAQKLRDALLEGLRTGSSRMERALAGAIAASPTLPPAHEPAIYFLQALALVHGSDDDQAVMSDGELAFLLLAANDYVFDWREPDERELTRAEGLVAECGRNMLYNRGHDAAATLVRGAAILEQRPRRTPKWQSEAAWDAVQRRAFGVGLADYVDGFVGPIVLTSEGWERSSLASGARGPVLDMHQWRKVFPLPPDLIDRYLGRLVIDREGARAALLADMREDGLPIGPTLFVRKPFVRFDERRIVPASPWVVRRQLQFGLWAEMRVGAAAEEGRSQSCDWPYAFGDLVEQWCQRVARMADASPRFVGRVVTASTPDDGEIEDVVIVQNRRVALISVKGSIVREDLLRGAQRRSLAVEFYERFFFAERKGKHRHAAAHQLDAKVARLRAGEFEPTVPRHAKVYPMVVTYDDLGIDSPGGYDFLSQRAKALGILQGARVMPLVCIPVETFESLLAYCAKGHNLFDILDKKATREWATGRLDSLLYDLSGSAVHRFPQIESEFEARSKRIRERMTERLREADAAGATESTPDPSIE